MIMNVKVAGVYESLTGESHVSYNYVWNTGAPGVEKKMMMIMMTMSRLNY